MQKSFDGGVVGKRSGLRRRSFALGEAELLIVDRMARDASAELFQSKLRVSGSSVIRALLSHAVVQGEDFFREGIFPFIREEFRSDRSWGRKG